MAVAMVSSLPYAKLAKVCRLPIWLLIFPVLGIVANLQLTFGLIVLAYLISGPVLWARAKATHQQIAV